MNIKEIIKVIKGQCEVIADGLNYELVDVEYLKEFGSYYLRVYIDKPGGVNLDDCQAMSELVSEKLDEKDLLSTAYYLEVSSPGLDRPLKNDRDLKRNIGKDIELSLYTAIDNKKKYEGELKDFNESSITLIDNKDKEIVIPRESVSLIKLVLKF